MSVESGTRTLVFGWNYASWGGAQIYTLAIVKEAINRGWEVFVALPRESGDAVKQHFQHAGARLIETDRALLEKKVGGVLPRLSRQYIRIRSEYALLKSLLKFSPKSTVIHLDIGPWQSWQLYTILLLKGFNVFATIHNYLSYVSLFREVIWQSRLRFLSLFSKFGVFTSNDHGRVMFRRWFGKKCWENIRVTYTAVDQELIGQAAENAKHRNELRTKFGIDTKSFLVLCVGQFIDRKGRWIFLEAAKKALEISDEYEFGWVMPSAPTAEEASKIEQYGLGTKFKVIESDQIGKERIDVLSFFTTADAFALPSYVEGLPIALLEAMALGIPSVSTNVFAIPEAIYDGETGLLIEPGDSDALIAAIERLRTDPAAAQRIASAGRSHVLKTFQESASAAVACDAFENALTR
jgi:glycosyltransferase involved in cell wall biosynthesis